MADFAMFATLKKLLGLYNYSSISFTFAALLKIKHGKYRIKA